VTIATITGETRIHCLFGYPVSHSLSPIIFNNAFKQMNANRTYVAFSVEPERLKEAVDAAKVLGFEGFNVTMPHKTRIVEFLDHLDDEAGEIGTVNTVSKSPHGLAGYNTDGEGASRAIRAHGFNAKGKRIIVLGAGGAARAIIRTLAREGDVTVLSRNPQQAETIADSTPGNGQVHSGPLTKSAFEDSVRTADLLVDATPVQTAVLVRTLNSSHSDLRSGLWVFDLAYDQPLEKLPEGVMRISPLEMLVQQAALSYELWMQEPAPFQLIRSTLVDHLGGDWK
jgi:shikimate dehydrogenase